MICSSIYGRASYEGPSQNGKFNYIIVSFDRNQLSVPTFMFNNFAEAGKLKHPVPMFVDNGIGGLFLEKGKQRLWFQIQDVANDSRRYE